MVKAGLSGCSASFVIEKLGKSKRWCNIDKVVEKK